MAVVVGDHEAVERLKKSVGDFADARTHRDGGGDGDDDKIERVHGCLGWLVVWWGCLWLLWFIATTSILYEIYLSLPFFGNF